jgi:hypothetical protein
MYKIISILLFLSMSMSSFAQKEPPSTLAEYKKEYNERIKKDRLAGIYIPKDLNDAFAELNKKIADKDKEKFKSLGEEEASHRLFFSLGRWIILNWGFDGGSRLSHQLKGLGIYHPEDMSTFIIRAYHRKLNNKDLALGELTKKIVDARKKERAEDLKDAPVISEETRKVKKKSEKQ